jgi:hypothetical protein
MWSFNFFDGASQSGNLTILFPKSLCVSESHWIVFQHPNAKILTKKAMLAECG